MWELVAKRQPWEGAPPGLFVHVVVSCIVTYFWAGKQAGMRTLSACKA
jgi:hypothetical protein